MHSLRLFCDIVRFRSFSRAAALHGITQSAASQRVGQLEKHLGVRLIDRTVRPWALTSVGRVYLHEVGELVDRYDRLEQRICRIGSDPQGQITVAAIYSAGIGLLSFIKDSFVAEYPRVSVALSYKRPEDVYETVRRQQCDLGILSYPEHWRDVGAIPLRSEVMSVVCASGHPLANRTKVHAGELASWPMASFESQLPVGRHLQRYLKQQNIKGQIASVFDNIDTIKGCLSETGQIAILPKRTVLREVTAGTLAVVELEPELLRPIAIVYRKRRGASNRNGDGNGSKEGPTRPHGVDMTEVFSPAAQIFVEYLIENAGASVEVVKGASSRH